MRRKQKQGNQRLRSRQEWSTLGAATNYRHESRSYADFAVSFVTGRQQLSSLGCTRIIGPTTARTTRTLLMTDSSEQELPWICHDGHDIARRAKDGNECDNT